MHAKINGFAPYGLLGLLFITALFFRPVLPIDETRYLTVAWEMFLQKQYAVLSLNFQPYHHKPPMLFWLINAVWEMFGVSRAAALIPIFAASASLIFLTQKLAQILMPEKPSVTMSVPWLMLGSVPFLIYSSLMMFDIMLTVFVLAVLVTFLDHVKHPKYYKPGLAGILIGLGVLVKGPVTYLYILSPLLLYPFWKQEDFIPSKQLYLSVFIAVMISIIPILAWLIPTLTQTGDDFAFWLVWNQTAGRVSGNFSSAHVRSVFFYFMIGPVMFLPWCFLPSFWKNFKQLKQLKAFRFLLSATIPVFMSFCLIAGKQPHYLVPLLPFVIIGFAFLLHESKAFKKLSMAMVLLLIIGQIIASQTIFYKYDLHPIAEFYNTHRSDDWAFVRKYQGEIGFLAKTEKPIESIEGNELEEWFENHPNGKAIVRYSSNDDISAYTQLFSQKYKGKHIGIFEKRTD